MATSVVGVDIGTDSIRAVEVTGVGRKPVVVRSLEFALPAGAVRSGEVAEVNTVTEALKQLWTAGKFRSKDVILGVGSPKVLVRDLSVPKLAPRELRASLPSYVQDMLPVPIADALLDFYPTSESATENGPVVNGLLVAAVKDSVLANVTAAQKAGLSVVGVDLIPFAMTRLQKYAGNVAFVDVGARTTNVVVVSNGVPQFVRIIATGGFDLTQALASRLEISTGQAEQLKLSLGLGTVGVAPENLPAVQIIREVTAELLNSLRNTLAYFANTRQNETYTGVVLSGGGANLAGFSDALSEITRIQVAVADPFTLVAPPKDLQSISVRDRQTFNVALGLALGGAA
ncbi:MAG: type IV pilus assembly protein PilM [Microbacteriaceae bacterium]